MSGLVVHTEHGRLEIGPGESVLFGRGASGVPVGLVLDDPAVPRLAGEILATEDHWRLSNLGYEQSLLVENPEGAGEYFRVAPRRIGAPVPFEFARVVLPTRSPDGLAVHVSAPGHSYAERVGELDGEGTVAAFSLDETATYFAVLVALCEPRLRDQSATVIPTTRQVAARLAGLSEQAVGFHIDYLARSKLRVKPAAEAGSRLEWKRELVVSLALRFGLVREEHLALLPARLLR
ncbi:serine/threonine protein kinase [Streptomyces sp. WAC07061]|uniref:serine/threonine protein kinase n=1 Tax=Streptomyces sp. WAC07061 TaxID=2487410 RepID=UPI000F799127|nr:serine/threonine protein kinase [Streptomyces sp. WAC07061]RSS48316.1 serine/threonine protein kinase [Streptomyces sp. WAC07061]